MAETVVRPRRRGARVKRMTFAIAAAVILLLTARSSLVGVYRVNRASDAPTLLLDDRVWVNLAAYDLRVPFFGWTLVSWGEPSRGCAASPAGRLCWSNASSLPVGTPWHFKITG